MLVCLLGEIAWLKWPSREGENDDAREMEDCQRNYLHIYLGNETSYASIWSGQKYEWFIQSSKTKAGCMRTDCGRGECEYESLDLFLLFSKIKSMLLSENVEKIIGIFNLH